MTNFFVGSVGISRKWSYQCSKYIVFIVNMAKNGQKSGQNGQKRPVMVNLTPESNSTPKITS